MPKLSISRRALVVIHGSTEIMLCWRELMVKWVSMKDGSAGWERIGLALHPQWRSCWNWEMYHGIVRRSGLRIGRFGLYRFWLRSSWPLPTCDVRPCWHDLRDDKEIWTTADPPTA